MLICIMLIIFIRGDNLLGESIEYCASGTMESTDHVCTNWQSSVDLDFQWLKVKVNGQSVIDFQWRTVGSDWRHWTILSDFGQLGRRHFFVPTALLSIFVPLFLHSSLFIVFFSNLLFLRASVRKNTLHDFHIFYSHTKCNLHFLK